MVQDKEGSNRYISLDEYIKNHNGDISDKTIEQALIEKTAKWYE